LYSKVEKIFLPNSSKDFIDYYVLSSRSEIVSNFVELINFFLAVNDEDVFYVVNSFIEAGNYKNQNPPTDFVENKLENFSQNLIEEKDNNSKKI
jgi:hypothetical protein